MVLLTNSEAARKNFSFVQHSSLFCHAVSDEEKVINDTGTWKWTRGLVSSQP